MKAKRGSPKKRLLIAFDGKNWYVRRIRVIEHDLTRDEKVYRCDEPIGGACQMLAEAIRIVQEIPMIAPTNAAKGRALLAEWKAQHSLVSPGVCSACQSWAPCPTSHLIAAVEEALAGLDRVESGACNSRYGNGCDGACEGVARRSEDAILAKLEAPE